MPTLPLSIPLSTISSLSLSLSLSFSVVPSACSRSLSSFSFCPSLFRPLSRRERLSVRLRPSSPPSYPGEKLEPVPSSVTLLLRRRHHHRSSHRWLPLASINPTNQEARICPFELSGWLAALCCTRNFV